MRQIDVWKHLIEGGKVRPKWWPKDAYAHFKDGYVCNQLGQKMEMWGFSQPKDLELLPADWKPEELPPLEQERYEVEAIIKRIKEGMEV